MKKLFKAILVLTFFPFVSYGQQEFLSDMRQMGAPVTANRYPDVKGSPYLNSDFASGEVTLKRGTPVKDVQIRYNAYEDVMEYLNGKDIMYMDSDRISGFMIKQSNGVPLIFRNGFSMPGFSAKNFFVVMNEGENQLLKRITKGMSPDPDVPYGSEGKMFSTSSSYHIVYEGSSYPNIKLNKKGILDVVNNRSKEVEDLVKTRKLDYRNENDVAYILSYLSESKS